jgi:hypothetical protein
MLISLIFLQYFKTVSLVRMQTTLVLFLRATCASRNSEVARPTLWSSTQYNNKLKVRVT